MLSSDRAGRGIWIIALAVVLALAWFAYLPALSGGFALDDAANLGGLAAIDDRQSALRFVFGGEAGPLGRPLALASFLLQADSWQEGARAFLSANVLLHLLNGCLVAAFLATLSQALPLAPADRRFAVLVATAMWLFMPMLASSSLMVIQRMTTLSATFVLAGLIAYLVARKRLEDRPFVAFTGMAFAIGIATLLAVLTKENGILMSTFVLVLEVTLLAAPAGGSSPAMRRLWLAIIALPTLFVLGYLASRLPYAEATILRRDFGGWERLLSESRILWLYLGKALLPVSGTVSPINDIYSVARSLWQPLTLLAMLSWTGLLAAAIFWRRRFPLAAFAVLWFLAGHLLESTVLPLELYFDHRNYLPIIGPVFALCAGAMRLPAKPRRIARLALPVYALFLCGSLYMLASLWGQPAVAAAVWYQKHPQSVRAATHHMSRQLDSSGVDAALKSLHDFVSRHPEHAYLLLQDLNIRCRLNPGADYTARALRLRQRLGEVNFTYTAGTMLSELFNVAAGARCASLTPDTLRALARALRDNRRYRGDTHYNAMHHQLVALSYRIEGDLDSAISELGKSAAFDAAGDATMLRIMTLAQAGRLQDAGAAISEARNAGPANPFRQRFWQQDLDAMERYVAALMQQQKEQTG